jgi:hypothetical protein
MELRVLFAICSSIQVGFWYENYDDIRGIIIRMWERMGKAISE